MNLSVQKESHWAGQAAVLVTAFLWSTSGLFIKLIPWNPIVIAGARSFVSAIFLLTVRQIAPPKKDAKNRAFPLWAGALTYAFTMITFVSANKLTTSANAILLQYGAPVWTAILGWYFVREKPNWEHWAALAAVIAGLLLFFRESLGSSAIIGDSLAVFSGILFGAQSVFFRMMKNGYPQDSMILGNLINAVICIPFAVLYPPLLTAAAVLPILYMGAVQIGLASLLFAYGIKRISAVQAMLTATLEPVCNPVWVLIFTGERPAYSAIIGGGIIIAAVLASSLIGMHRAANK